MSRSLVEVSLDWTLVSSLPVVITIHTEKLTQSSAILFNTVPSDEAAERIIVGNKGKQVTQKFHRNTYVRATVEGWKVVVDE